MTTPRSLPTSRTDGAPVGLRRISGLDGLRAIAVIAVIVFHCFPGVLRGGFLGVDVFFVISGFLITSLLLRERSTTGRIAFAEFWRRRARRLLPALVAMLLITASLAWVIGGDTLAGLDWQLLGAATFSYNWLSIATGASYFADGVPELYRNLWSLAVEEQFYLLWPLAVVGLSLLPRARVRFALVVVAGAASAIAMAALVVPDDDPTRVYFGSDTHAFGLLAGAAVAIWSESRSAARAPSALRLTRAVPIGAALIGVIVAASVLLREDDPLTYRGGLVIISVTTACLIALAVRTPAAGALLDVRPLQWIGERSYGLYLWHWPIYVLVLAALPGALLDPFAVTAVGFAVVAITVLAAALSYRWLEEPIRRRGFRGLARRSFTEVRDGRRSVIRTAVLVAPVIVVALVGASAAAVTSVPAKTSAQAEVDRGLESLRHTQAGPQLPPDVTTIPKEPDATFAPTPTPTVPERVAGDQISAIGDSVMLASAPELQATFPGIWIDATVSRSMWAAPEILRALADSAQLRQTVGLGLGTNGSFDAEVLSDVLDIVGPERNLVLVNAFADREWIEGVNVALGECARRERSVELADWSAAIAPRTDLLAEDNIHPGPTAGQLYADEIATALDRLAALPTLIPPGARIPLR